jgi:hypothetical protein
VNALVFQSDGKLLVGGSFTSSSTRATGTAVNRSNMARLNADGTVDSYNPGPNAAVNAIALQPPDGKAVIGGAFNGVRPDEEATYARAGIARLNLDGTIDLKFQPHRQWRGQRARRLCGRHDPRRRRFHHVPTRTAPPFRRPAPASL